MSVRFMQVCPPPNTVAVTKIQVRDDVVGYEVADVEPAVVDDDVAADVDDMVEAESVVPEAKVVRGPARKTPKAGPAAARVKA